MGSFRNHFETIFGQLWNHFGIVWNPFDIIFKSFGEIFGIIWGLLWDHFCDNVETLLGPFCDPFETILGSFRDYPGILSGSFGITTWPLIASNIQINSEQNSQKASIVCYLILSGFDWESLKIINRIINWDHSDRLQEHLGLMQGWESECGGVMPNILFG